MDHPLDFVAKIDRDGQDVVIAADGGIGITKNLAKLGIAKQTLDLLLDALVDVGQLQANLGKLRAGHVEHVTAAVDAAGDRLGHHAQVFHGS